MSVYISWRTQQPYFEGIYPLWCVVLWCRALQPVTGSAQPAYRQPRRWTPATSTSLSTAPKSTETWCSSSQGSKGEHWKCPHLHIKKSGVFALVDLLIHLGHLQRRLSQHRSAGPRKTQRVPDRTRSHR